MSHFRVVPISTQEGIKYAIQQNALIFFWVTLTDYVGYETRETILYSSHKDAVCDIKRFFGEAASIINYKC